MSKTLTIRASDSLQAKLRERAEEQGKSLSQIVREILESALAERPMKDRIGHLKGSLKGSGDGREAWRRRIRERNWSD